MSMLLKSALPNFTAKRSYVESYNTFCNKECGTCAIALQISFDSHASPPATAKVQECYLPGSTALSGGLATVRHGDDHEVSKATLGGQLFGGGALGEEEELRLQVGEGADYTASVSVWAVGGER